MQKRTVRTVLLSFHRIAYGEPPLGRIGFDHRDRVVCDVDVRLAFDLQKKSSEIGDGSLRFDLHAPVRQIFYSAGKAELFCKQARGIAEADELHLAFEQDMPSDVCLTFHAPLLSHFSIACGCAKEKRKHGERYYFPKNRNSICVF